jgi:beta-lactamase regulating signal transducer with metallopeptidase domain
MIEFLGQVAEAGPELAIRSTVLFVLAIGLSMAWPRASAAQRHLLWNAALAGSLVLPILYFSVPKYRVWPAWTDWMAQGDSVPQLNRKTGKNDLSSISHAPSQVALDASPEIPSAAPIRVQPSGFFRSKSIQPILGTLWLAGVSLGLARLWFGFARLRSIARHTDPARGQLESMLKELSHELGIGQPVKGLVSRDPLSPMTWGWWRPVVALPGEANSWSAERLRLVLLHELAHVRRLDFVSQLAGELARCLYWFHPLAWWCLRRLRIEQEVACDDWVLASGAHPEDYAQELLDITANLPHPYPKAGVALAMSRTQRIETRIRSILQADRNRNRASTWRRISIASLFAMLATTTALVGPSAVAKTNPSATPIMPTPATSESETGNNDATPDPQQDPLLSDAQPLTEESKERLKNLATGQSFPATRQDMPLAIAALQANDWTIRSQSCLAIEKMASRKLFAPEDLPSLWEGLQPNLQSQHQDTSEWSVRAVATLLQEHELFSSPFWSQQDWMLEREPTPADRSAGEFLKGSFEESLLLLGSSDRELQRRGANLTSQLLKHLPQSKQEKAIRSLLDIPFETQTAANPSSSLARCRRQVTIALVHSASVIPAESSVGEVAERLLEASKDVDAVMNDGVYRGLAFLADKTQGELRQRIVRAVVLAATDRRWIYSRTSGISTPPRHHGADALTILAPGLTSEELLLAQEAIPPLPEGEGNRAAYDAMYLEVLQALAGRKKELESKMQPAAREEEDLAFFEKKYKKKFTEVKPKSEYPDPDQFYSAIAKELGISEIAWKAAAEKFGWKKEDGRNTFAMLKGGPTSEGGEGTWDVFFIRSMINPETKRPDPATIERVMVQIDYDGKISFQKIP